MQHGIREYLVYEIYNKMGIKTQDYFLGHLKLGDVDRGLITVVEVINENYIKKAYNYEHANLYKPIMINENEYAGADFRYLGDDLELYKGIFNKTKTIATLDEDKQRLIKILANINSSSDSKAIEENFIDFDKIIKMVAIDKALGCIDTFTRNYLRNSFLYEENGKIDILMFDCDFSLNYNVSPEFWTQNINEFDLTKDDAKIYSRIIEIINENEEYTKKYYQYVEETIQILEEMNENGTIDELLDKTEKIVLLNECTIYSKKMYARERVRLKEFIENRRNDWKVSIGTENFDTR